MEATHWSDSYWNYAQDSRHISSDRKTDLTLLEHTLKSLEMNQARSGMVNLGSLFSWRWDPLRETPLGRLVRVFHGRITRRGKSFAPECSALLRGPNIKRSGRNSGFYLSTLVNECCIYFCSPLLLWSYDRASPSSQHGLKTNGSLGTFQTFSARLVAEVPSLLDWAAIAFQALQCTDSHGWTTQPVPVSWSMKDPLQ